MTIEDAKKLLPDNLIYPLPDSVLDCLTNYKAEEVELGDAKYVDRFFQACVLAALIELKERRMEDNIDAKNIQRHE